MSENPQQTPSLFTRIDVSTHTSTEKGSSGEPTMAGVAGVLQQLLAAQDRQNELMEELIEQLGNAQRQRAAELSQWRQANPRLRAGAGKPPKSWEVQSAFLDSVTEEINDNVDYLMEGEFMLNEFVDRFGPRLAHLNGVLQVLSQLSSNGQEA